MNSASNIATRLKSLDLLRLLLCLWVMLTHARRIFGVSFPVWLTKGMLDAKGGVVLFFVLSGYVLTKSLARSPVSVRAYLNYIVKRVCRLFPMYWAALLLTFVVLLWIKREGLGWWGSESVHFLRQEGFGIKQWLLHIALMVPGMDSEFALPTVWSLMTESKISLFAFPLFGWLMLRSPMWVAICISAVLVGGSDFLYTRVLATAAYLGMFGIGATLAKVSDEAWARLPAVIWWIVLFLGCVMYSCMSFRYDLPSVWIGYYLCAVGSGLIIACVGHWPALSKSMHAVYSLVGLDLSYGIYILHYPILVAFLKVGGGKSIQHPMLWGSLAMVASVALAWVLAHLVEIPMIKFGRRLTQN